ncbi:unnamed protein product [Trichogramma brassicae]|uniref:BTB domain-containing protein n=1 Tax=Trichogramma brassicae TaxID=86971 RepID=A0A6H5ITI5_9HYME|nr:unnamed protein product [Trichogramma brassicae]
MRGVPPQLPEQNPLNIISPTRFWAAQHLRRPPMKRVKIGDDILDVPVNEGCDGQLSITHAAAAAVPSISMRADGSSSSSCKLARAFGPRIRQQQKRSVWRKSTRACNVSQSVSFREFEFELKESLNLKSKLRSKKATPKTPEERVATRYVEYSRKTPGDEVYKGHPGPQVHRDVSGASSPAEEIIYLRCDEASTRVFECDRRDLCRRSSVFQQIYGKFMKIDAPRVILLRGVEQASLLKLHDALVHGNALVLHHERPGYDRLARLFKLSEDCRVNVFPWDHPQEQKVARTRVYRQLDASKPWKQLEIAINDGQRLVCKQTVRSPKKP